MADPNKPIVPTTPEKPVAEEAQKSPVKQGFKHLKKGKSVCQFGRTFKTWVPDSVIKALNLQDWLFLGGPKEPTKEDKAKAALAKK